MDWIQGIQRAIDYAEENMTQEIDFEEAAKRAYSSPFHFQRVFGILCGYSFGDYIRMRRLSLAGEELSKGNARIIDIALKYGYDSPESFSRAFTRFHGITPSEAKHSGSVRVFTPLCIKLILTGGRKMDYRIEKKRGLSGGLQKEKSGQAAVGKCTARHYRHVERIRQGRQHRPAYCLHAGKTGDEGAVGNLLFLTALRRAISLRHRSGVRRTENR